VPSSESQSKFAVVIGKKVNKFAVKRNLIKRRVHEAIRIWSKKLPRQVNAIILPKAVSIQKNATDFIHEMEQGVRL